MTNEEIMALADAYAKAYAMYRCEYVDNTPAEQFIKTTKQTVEARAALLAALQERDVQNVHTLGCTSKSVQTAKLQVTLVDRPVDIELAQYKRMFEAACVALGSINEALGLDPNDGGAEPILDAIQELKVAQPVAQPLSDEDCTRIYNEANNITIKNPPLTTARIFAAMRMAHGIGAKEHGRT